MRMEFRPTCCRCDGNVFDRLKQLAGSEGSNLASSDGLGMLASIGIMKGQPFSPEEKSRLILYRAARTAYKMSRVIGFEEDGAGHERLRHRRWRSGRCCSSSPSDRRGLRH